MKGTSREKVESGALRPTPDSVDAGTDSTQEVSDGRQSATGVTVPRNVGNIEEPERTRGIDRTEAVELLASDPYYALRFYERTLDPNGTPKEKVQIPKAVLPSLPDRFKRTRLAKMPDGSVGSYRDMNASVHSSHIHEYPDHWELHVDCFNPHYRPIEHALVDTGVSGQAWDTVTALLVGTLATLTVTRDLTVESSRLGDLEFGSVGTALLDATLTGLAFCPNFLGLF